MTDRNTLLPEDGIEDDNMDLTKEDDPKEVKSGKAFVEKVRSELGPFEYDTANLH